MPRAPRVHVPGGCYHVTCRGNHQERLFATADDRDALNELVADAVQRFELKIHAFCWMTNHLHFLTQVSDQPLGKPMQRIEQLFSRFRHKLMNVTGHLFDKRYGSKIVDVDNYFRELLRYIHLNPVHAGIVYDPADYRWSSHKAYLGLEQIDWLTTDFGLSFFGREIDQARAAYLQFIQQPLDEFGMRVKSVTLSKDSRVLGSDAFAARLGIRPLRPPDGSGLDQLVEQFCAERGISVPFFRSNSRDRSLTLPRIQFARQAIHSNVANASQVAQFLNRSPSALYQLLARYPDTES